MTIINCSITYEPDPQADDLLVLNAGLSEYAKNKRDMKAVDSFAYFIRDNSDKILGGCAGDNFYGCLYIGKLWVEELLRGKGYGTKLIQLAEELAVKNRSTFIAVNTFDWQALDFYKKFGFYVEFERTGFDKNSIFYFLRKNL
jgi:ribosomal protein S18 acetylase RimI-like enzyme